MPNDGAVPVDGVMRGDLAFRISECIHDFLKSVQACGVQNDGIDENTLRSFVEIRRGMREKRDFAAIESRHAPQHSRMTHRLAQPAASYVNLGMAGRDAASVQKNRAELKCVNYAGGYFSAPRRQRRRTQPHPDGGAPGGLRVSGTPGLANLRPERK